MLPPPGLPAPVGRRPAADQIGAVGGRLIAASLTEEQVLDGSKTVTRRLGWWTDKRGRRLVVAGDRLRVVRKSMGRRRGDHVEPLVYLAVWEVTGVRREPLEAIDAADVAREGFPGWSPDEFVRFFCRTHRGCQPDSEITRISVRYPTVDELGLADADQVRRVS